MRKHGTERRRFLALCAAAASGGPTFAQLKTGDNPEASSGWLRVREPLFGKRPIRSDAEAVIALDAPNRAEDAAIVPIGIRAQFPQSADRWIQRMWLVIDNNPSPVGVLLQYTQASGRADIETRVRVDEYTFVRAIAETNDNQLWMATRFVKASGGCSAPPGKDPAAALASLGQMRLRVDGGGGTATSPTLAQLMISHPNHSGLAMDQMTRQFTPPHFVRHVEITYGGRPVLTADVDFTLSENPNLRFYFVPRESGELKANIVDSRDQRFETAIRYNPAA